MSWQSYVDNSLVGSGHVSEAAIFGLDHSDEWATSAGFKIRANEIKEIISAFENADNIRASGVHLTGVKYLTLKADDKTITGKKGADGCTIYKTNKAVLIGVYKEGMQPNSCENTVVATGVHLETAGF